MTGARPWTLDEWLAVYWLLLRYRYALSDSGLAALCGLVGEQLRRQDAR